MGPIYGGALQISVDLVAWPCARLCKHATCRLELVAWIWNGYNGG